MRLISFERGDRSLAVMCLGPPTHSRTRYYKRNTGIGYQTFGFGCREAL